jgi:hypothetical protein
MRMEGKVNSMISNGVFVHNAFQRIAMAAFAGVVALGSGIASADAEQAEGLEGAWRVQIRIVDCASGVPLPGPAGADTPPIRELLAFARGGTVSGATDESLAFQPGQLSSEHGIWRVTGAHTYVSVRDALILYTTEPKPPMPGFLEGTQRFREAIRVEGDRYAGKAFTQFLDRDGNVQRTGCTVSSGVRFK